MIPPVAASDRGEAQTGRAATRARGCRAAIRGGRVWGRNGLEGPAAAGESPLRPPGAAPRRCLSSAGHVKPCANPAGPPAKAKYSGETDSAPVP